MWHGDHFWRHDDHCDDQDDHFEDKDQDQDAGLVLSNNGGDLHGEAVTMVKLLAMQKKLRKEMTKVCSAASKDVFL